MQKLVHYLAKFIVYSHCLLHTWIHLYKKTVGIQPAVESSVMYLQNHDNVLALFARRGLYIVCISWMNVLHLAKAFIKSCIWWTSMLSSSLQNAFTNSDEEGAQQCIEQYWSLNYSISDLLINEGTLTFQCTMHRVI